MISLQVDGIEYRFFNYLYAVSRCGKVLKKLTPTNPRLRPDGYLEVGRKMLVHRLVATLWCDNPNKAPHVHHINHIKSDNNANNLKWVTPKEHIAEFHKDLYGHYTRTDETKEKLRQYRLGKVTSEETKAKQRAALINKTRPYFARASHSEESKQKRSKNHIRNSQCVVFGITYRSLAEASRATGINKGTLRKRCLSKNFTDYELTSPLR